LSGFGAITNANNIFINGTNVLGTLTTPGAILLGGNITMETNTSIYFNVGTNNTKGPAGGSDYIGMLGTGTAQFNNPRIFMTLAGPLIPSATYTLIDCSNATSVAGTVNAESPRYAPVLVTSTGVVMVVNADTTVGSVTWIGQLGPVWDTSLVNTNWAYSSSSDAFRQYDNVVFDDSCSNTTVWPSGQLYPSSVTFNGNTKNLAVTNRSGVTPFGSVNGTAGLTKNGVNTVIWGITNTFTGPVNINNGVLKLFDPTFTTPGGALILGTSNGPINVASGGTLDIGGVGVISIGKTNYIAGNGFNGQGAITNSATSGGPTERWYIKLTADASIALNTAPMTLQNPAQTATYDGWLDLNGFTLTKNGASAFIVQQCSVTNSGDINLAGGEFRLNHSWLGGSGSLNLSNATTLSCASGSTTSLVTKASINIPASSSAAIVAPNNASASTPTFLIGSPINLAGSVLVSNAMLVRMTNLITGSGSLTKAGNSNLVLTAANAYTGPITINGGRIVLTNSGTVASTSITCNGGAFDILANGYTLGTGQTLNLNATTNGVIGNLVVGSGATILGIGTNSGNLTVNSGTLSPGPLVSVGTLAVVSNLTLNGASIPFQLGSVTSAGGADNDLIVCSSLTLSGSTIITISAVGTLVTTPSTPYTLVRYSGTLSGGAANLSIFSSNPRYTFALIDPTTTPGEIKVQVTAIGSTLDVWRGLNPSKPSTWDVASTPNWLNGGGLNAFFNGDTVVFDNTGLTNGVDLTGTLAPAAMIVSNNATPYTLRGSGRLQAGSLTLDSSSTGGLTIANTASNNFVGAGITLNAGTTLTMNQPANTLLTATLNGSGIFAKQGANSLTVIGNSDTNFTGTNLVLGGILRPGSVGALGGTNTTINIVSGGELDLNGQAVGASNYVAGAGPTGAGAVDNTGAILLTNKALASLVLTGPTTLGASSNRWDVGRWIPDTSLGSQPPWIPVGSYFNAQSNTLVKVGSNDVYIHASGETYLADVNIGAGRLVIENPTWTIDSVTPTLGYNQNTITVSNGATLGLGNGYPFQQQASGVTWGVDGGTKPLHLLSGGRLESLGGEHNLGGIVTMETNTVIQSDSASGKLHLAGTVQGPGALFVTGSGVVELSAANEYQTNSVVSGATLAIARDDALPKNSLVVLSNTPSALALVGGIASLSDRSLKMLSVNSSGGGTGPTLSGYGTWAGPIEMNGGLGFTFNGTVDGLNITGPINSSNALGTVTLDYDSIHFATALRFQGTMNVTYQSALSAGTLHRPIITLDAQNYWTNMTVTRARINIRTNDALPPLSPITAGTLLAGVSDRTLILDLGGYNQTVSSITANFGFIDEFRIGNSSTVSDSLLTYAGTGQNSWSAIIMDDLDLSGGKKIGLNVTSGSLTLSGISTYTGPTTVSGGQLFITGELGNTEAKVGTGGLLGGIGTIDGSVTNAAGGTLAPGIFIGTLTVLGPVTLQSGSVCSMEVNNQVASNDKLVAGGITYGGTLLVTNTTTTPYTNGQVLQLFTSTAGYSGSFSSIQIPGVAAYDASNLTVDGSITVITPTSTVPVPISTTVTGNQLKLGWPADHQGWRLQGQTNSAGIGTNWHDVPGSTQTNSITMPIVPNNPPVFFRLVYP
jgi:autotransporter-associated beta strand protein